MATAYHMEALRKQRILERKQEAAMRMAAQEQGVPVTDMSASNIANAGTTIQPDYANMSAARHCENHRASRWDGIHWNKRMYDHTRHGPVLLDSWKSLSQEFCRIGSGYHNVRVVGTRPTVKHGGK